MVLDHRPIADAGLVLEIFVVRQVAIPLPHPLFYAVFTTLPFYWHSGILLVPLTMLVSGTMRTRHPTLTNEDAGVASRCL
jgi:hypothetical protein